MGGVSTVYSVDTVLHSVSTCEVGRFLKPPLESRKKFCMICIDYVVDLSQWVCVMVYTPAHYFGCIICSRNVTNISYSALDCIIETTKGRWVGTDRTDL